MAFVNNNDDLLKRDSIILNDLLSLSTLHVKQKLDLVKI